MDSLLSPGSCHAASKMKQALKKQSTFCRCCFVFLRQGFSAALKSVLELTLVNQASLELTEICLLLPPEYWD